MKKKRRGFFFRFNFFLTILLFSQNCNLLLHANANIPLDAKAAVLIEFTTGKILFEKDSDLKIYPASMTKMMTALVALDYLTTDQIFIVGDEIFALAGNLMRAGHQVGESVCVMTLLNLLLIRSGNETACVLALNTAKAAAGKNMAYQEAEKIFCRLMNEKARKIGAVNTNFTNPHGGHNDEHYSTAYDISLISRAFMQNDLLRQIVSQPQFVGDSIEGTEKDNLKILHYNWANHNELITGGVNHYIYATGIKTGFTNQAGECIAASAKKGRVELISVICDSLSPGRWRDARMLFDYGFEEYSFKKLHSQNEILDEIKIRNIPLGENDLLTIYTADEVVMFLSNDEYDKIFRTVFFYDNFLNSEAQLAAPINENDEIGIVKYFLNNEIIYEEPIVSYETFAERSFDLDVDYYMSKISTNIFSKNSLPYWFGITGFMAGIAGFIIAVRAKNDKRNWRKGFYSLRNINIK